MSVESNTKKSVACLLSFLLSILAIHFYCVFQKHVHMMDWNLKRKVIYSWSFEESCFISEK